MVGDANAGFTKRTDGAKCSHVVKSHQGGKGTAAAQQFLR